MPRVWYEVWGVEAGLQPPPCLLYKFPAEQWSEDFAAALQRQLEEQGVTQIRVVRTEE